MDYGSELRRLGEGRSPEDVDRLASVLLHHGLAAAVILANDDGELRETLESLDAEELADLLREDPSSARRLALFRAALLKYLGLGPRERSCFRRLRREVSRLARELLSPLWDETPSVRPGNPGLYWSEVLPLEALAHDERAKPKNVRIGKLDDAVRFFREFTRGPAFDAVREVIDAYYRALLDHLDPARFEVRELTLEFEYRLIVGMGGPHPAENDVFLDHTTGLPVIPGTALKGVARAAGEAIFHFWEKYGGKDDPRETAFDTTDREEARRLFTVVFGSPPGGKGDPERAGAVRFFDAFPDPDWLKEVGSPLEVDVVNPHFKEYYEGKEPPHESMQPNPIRFLAVKSGSRWRVVVAADERCSDDLPADEVLDVAVELLRLGAGELGVGARTAAGYGRGSAR